MAAEPLTAIATGVSVLSKLRSLSDSRGIRTDDLVLENKELLLKLHKRLDVYDAKFQKVLKSLDELPARFQKRFKEALGVDQIRKVRGAIQLIVSDLNVDAKPIVDIKSRLSDLQKEAQTLLNHTNDLIFFDVLAAMYVEQTVIVLQRGYSKDQLRKIIENRRKDYHSRFKEMLVPWDIMKKINGKKHYESLPELKKRAEASLKKYIEHMNSIISQDEKNRFVYYSYRSNCGAYQCYGTCTEVYTLLNQKVDDTRKQFRRIVEGIGHVERSLLFYRNMWNAIQLELSGANEDLKQEEIRNIAYDYQERGKRLNLFGKLKKRIKKDGHCPHG